MQETWISLLAYMPVIYFVYGMTFLMLGLTISLEHAITSKSKQDFWNFLRSPLGSLSLFGLMHSVVDFMEMISILNDGLPFWARIALLFVRATSFNFLYRFGMRFDLNALYSYEDKRTSAEGKTGDDGSAVRKALKAHVPNISFFLWLFLLFVVFFEDRFSEEWFAIGDASLRYLNALPASFFAGTAFLGFRKKSSLVPDRALVITAASFFVYGLVTGLVVEGAEFFPASLMNYEMFYSVMGVPVQMLRSVCAVVITIALFKMLGKSGRFATIRVKALIHIFIAVVIPTLMISLFVSYVSGGALIELSYLEKEKISGLIADDIMNYFDRIGDEVTDQLFHFQLSPGIVEEELLRSFVVGNEKIDGIAFIVGGREIFSVGEGFSSSAFTYSRGVGDIELRQVLSDAVSARDPESYSLRHENERLNLFMPFTGGKIKILLNRNDLNAAISVLRIEQSWNVFLLDDLGTPVVPWKGEASTVEEAMRVIPHLSISEFDKKGAYLSAAPGKGSLAGWSVLVEIPRSEVLAPVFKVYKGLLFGTLVLYLSIIGVALFFVGRVMKPLDHVFRRVSLIGEGDLEQKPPIKTGDELQALSEEIEKMALHLAEKKRMESQIAQTEKIASVGRLAAGIAHEINNPLGIILGYCQLILKESGPGSRHYEDLKIIEKHTLASKKILGELLTFSRPFRNVGIPVDINQNIRETFALLPHRFLREKVKFIFDLSTLSPKINGDPDKLHQLYLNLIMNAIDAMPDGGTLSVGTRIIETDGSGQVEVTFRDTGCGISPEDMKNIFDPFFTTKEVGKGTGLGLSVSYGIVKDHHGEIRAESEAGKGTVFSMVFPVAQEHDST